MTATASNQSQKCWGRRPHFPFGGLLISAETERWILWICQWLIMHYAYALPDPRDTDSDVWLTSIPVACLFVSMFVCVCVYSRQQSLTRRHVLRATSTDREFSVSARWRGHGEQNIVSSERLVTLCSSQQNCKHLKCLWNQWINNKCAASVTVEREWVLCISGQVNLFVNCIISFSINKSSSKKC